jgi:hypothetical protein
VIGVSDARFQSDETRVSTRPGVPPAPPGFAMVEEYNHIQIAFMKLVRLLWRRK